MDEFTFVDPLDLPYYFTHIFQYLWDFLNDFKNEFDIYYKTKIINFIWQLFFTITSTEVLLLCIFIGIAYLLDKKFNIKKPRKWFMQANKFIWERIFSFLAYYIPYLDVLTMYFSTAYPRFIELRILIPHTVKVSLDFYQNYQVAISFSYIWLVYALINIRFPPNRFIRFNMMYSVIIMSLQTLFNQVYYDYMLHQLNSDYKFNLAIWGLIFCLLSIFPAMFRALIGRYPSNSFMREAVEVHLGRDGEDFVWWDRRGKKKE